MAQGIYPIIDGSGTGARGRAIAHYPDPIQQRGAE
jgi:hypothetical protein